MTTHNPFSTVTEFENAMKEYTGAPFAVAVDSCTSALFLSFKYQYDKAIAAEHEKGGMHEVMPAIQVLTMPKHTHISVPLAAIHAGWPLQWADHDVNACGHYRIGHLPVFDSALRLGRHMFKDLWRREAALAEFVEIPEDAIIYMCQSFQYRKHIPIGRGGMILHNDPEADKWFRKARFFGREEVPMMADPGPTMLGWKLYMLPEEAARGLCFMQNIPDNPPDLKILYPDLSKYKVFETYVEDTRQ